MIRGSKRISLRREEGRRRRRRERNGMTRMREGEPND
jgi:hypothetical protein